MDSSREGSRDTGWVIQVGGNTLSSMMILKVFVSALWKNWSSQRCIVTESLFCTKGPTHRLEITPSFPEPELEHPQSALRLADLTSEEEEGLHGRISQYERKIDSLLTEVSSLKNEVSLSFLIRSLFIISVRCKVLHTCQNSEMANDWCNAKKRLIHTDDPKLIQRVQRDRTQKDHVTLFNRHLEEVTDIADEFEQESNSEFGGSYCKRTMF